MANLGFSKLFLLLFLFVGLVFASPSLPFVEKNGFLFVGDAFSQLGKLVDLVSIQVTGRAIFFAELPQCTDSDGGINPYVRGTSTGYYSGGIASQNFVFGENPDSSSSAAGSYRIDSSLNGSSIYYDHCFDSETSKQLNEGFCDSSTGKMGAFGYPCQYGCKGGVCLKCSGAMCNPGNALQYCSGGNWVDCPSGQICSGFGTCIQAQCSGTECNVNNPAQICNNGQWNTCQLGYVCRNSACVQGCSGTTCNPTNGQQYCSNGNWADCPSGQVCSSGSCVGAPANNTPSSNATTNATVGNAASAPSQGASSSAPPVSPLPPVNQTPVQLACSANTCNPANDRAVCSNGQWVECPGNATCSAGVCLSVVNVTNVTPAQPAISPPSSGGRAEVEQPRTRPQELPEAQRENESVPQGLSVQCDGCIVNNRCVPIGYRVSGNYCLLNGTLALQQPESAFCENHFECNSNLCASGKCVSSNLIVQLIEWLKRLIGLAG